MLRESASDRLFNVVNLTLITLVMIIVLYPLIFILSSSFSDPSLVATGQVWLWPRGLNIAGYREVFKNSSIMLGYRNTLYYTFVGTVISLAVTLLAAYALARRNLVGRQFIMFLIVFTMYFSGGMIPTYLIVKSLKLLDTWFVVIAVSVVSTYNLIIARTFFSTGVPRELEEAAEIDGCSQARTFFLIVLPLSKALIGVLALYYGVGQWNSWFAGMIYLTSRDKAPLQLILRDLLNQQQINTLVTVDAYGSDNLSEKVKIAELIKYCVIVVASVPVLIVYPFVQKYFDKGVMLGSLKG